MKSVENKTSLILDLFLGLVFIPLLVILGPAYRWAYQWPLFFIIVCVYLYVCYFTVSRMNIPKLLISHRYCHIAGVIMILIAVNYLLSWYPLPDMDFVTPALSEYQTQVRNFGVSVTLWLMFSLVMGYSLTISFVKELYEQLLLKKKIEAQRDLAELAVFKAQISPHFMFNTLNSLYSLVIGTSEKAENAFIKFTDILKYTYVTIEKEAVPLKEEIEYIQNYIDLQLIRLNTHTIVNWSYDVDNEQMMVPPMLMLTFVENSFKYGASTSKDCVIYIHLDVKNGHLEFETQNSIMKHADEFRKDVPIGIENCRSRLAGLFPMNHSLDVNEDNGIFKVLLKIQLK
ncbi:MAG: histidine kinase [Muribaculaceae bacterium]|nr:histidine kinase [Muribaculaceae bacterium]